MADYYSECACLIEANPTHADVLLEAMNELFEPDDSFIQKVKKQASSYFAKQQKYKKSYEILK